MSTEEITDAEIFSALRRQSQSKRQRNQASSAGILRQRGIAFESRNGGNHLIIRRGDRVWDFWPSTGKWRERDRSAMPGEFAVHRKSVRDGRGVFNLLKVLEASDGEAA